MKHESFKSHLNQHKQRQQKTNILYQHTFKVEKQHSLNKRHFSLKRLHAPQRIIVWPETSASSAVYQNNSSIDRRYIDLLSDQQSFEEKALFGQRGLSDTLWHCYTDPIELMHWQCKGAFQSIVVTHTNTHTISPPGQWELHSAKYCM